MELRTVEDEAIRAAVKMQEEVGLQSATDGEFRRSSWHMDFIRQLGGIEIAGELEVKGVWRDETRTADLKAEIPRVVDRIHLEGTIFGDDFAMLRSAMTTATPKLTIPSPSMLQFGGRSAVSEEVYPDFDDYARDLSAAYAEEIRRLGELGCTYLQLDDTFLAFLNDPRHREQVAQWGGDPERQHLFYIRQLNEALAARPAGMTVTTHMCRGNYRSMWAFQGGYDFVAEALFNELAVDGFFLEYDDERSGSFEPLRFVPRGKLVVLGLVTTKRPELESKEGLKRRIEEASRFVPLEQLCISPQCGFASTVEGNELTLEQQVAKLRLVVETAQEVWG